MSRSETPDPFGKRTVDLRTKVATDVAERIRQEVFRGTLGKTESEVAAAIISAFFLTKAEMVRLHEAQMDLLFPAGK